MREAEGKVAVCLPLPNGNRAGVDDEGEVSGIRDMEWRYKLDSGSVKTMAHEYD